MKNFSQKILVGFTVVAAIFLMFSQYVEGVIGDIGKPSQRGIISDDKPSTEFNRLIFKQSLLQDVAKIKKEIKMLQTKLNKAQEGENLTILTVTLSAKNLKAFFNSLSAKINDAQANQRSIGNIQKLSEGASRGIEIVNGLEQKAGVNMKSDSLKLSNELSKLLIGLESEINSL